MKQKQTNKNNIVIQCSFKKNLYCANMLPYVMTMKNSAYHLKVTVSRVIVIVFPEYSQGKDV